MGVAFDCTALGTCFHFLVTTNNPAVIKIKSKTAITSNEIAAEEYLRLLPAFGPEVISWDLIGLAILFDLQFNRHLSISQHFKQSKSLAKQSHSSNSSTIALPQTGRKGLPIIGLSNTHSTSPASAISFSVSREHLDHCLGSGKGTSSVMMHFTSHWPNARQVLKQNCRPSCLIPRMCASS